ncbi:hypothetical protein NW768_007397 [Fusarium equiseti]|uniref:Uncharacterized protein n=1 Tax=Fusarium equiseti TaxID=61235 RepID=A0ABQ8R835_FUSEQ|nr:hypothetical protein NW768_007397 [Fusarium equiseti]
MCKIEVFHKWCKCGGFEKVDWVEENCDKKGTDGHMSEGTNITVKNIDGECAKCESIRLQREAEEAGKKTGPDVAFTGGWFNDDDLVPSAERRELSRQLLEAQRVMEVSTED